MNYAYVCTNYNNAHFTVDAVRTICAGTKPPGLIVVVDNQSAAEDVAKLRELAAGNARVDLVLNPENIGYFPGLNVGIARVHALAPSIDCMVIGNNDLEFPADFGEQLEDVLADAADRPVLSPYIETLDGLPQNPHVISGLSRKRELVYDFYYANYQLAKLIRWVARLTRGASDRHDEQEFATARYIYQGHGSCYVLTPAFFAQFEQLWAPTFMMGEEYFLSRQLSERGYMVYYDPRVRIRHRCNGSIENVPARKMWELARDAHRVYRRYVKPWHRQAHGPNRKSGDA